MELDKLVPPSEGLKVILPNGVLRNISASAEDCVLSAIVSEAGNKKRETVVPHGDIEKAGKLDESVIINASGELQEGSKFPKESNGSTLSKKEEDKGADDSKQFNPQEGLRNSKTENPLLTKNVTSTSGNKGKDETCEVPASASSNGSGTSHDSQKSNQQEGQGNSKNKKPLLTKNVSSTSVKKGKVETDAAPASAFTYGAGTLQDSKQSNPQGCQGKNKNENPSLTKNVSSASVKRGRDETDTITASAFSNGSGTSHDSKQSNPQEGRGKSENENHYKNVSSTSMKKGKDETDAASAYAFSNSSGTSYKQSNPQDGQGKIMNENISLTTNASSTSVQKDRDETDAAPASIFSNVYVSSHPNPEEPTKSMSFSDRQAQLSKQSGKSDGEGIMEKPDMKPLKKGAVNEYEGDSQSSLSPTGGNPKHHRVGSLPNYGFSFRCNKRAEKRREFYSKLEEKIHAKEVEQCTLQAKSKEAQEAELKMLRKSLNFKATPLPSFYQEPPPSKPELKKMPLTRPKSPKLGRKKSATSTDSDNNGRSVRPARLSLDQRLFQNKTVKQLSPTSPVKPQRRSLTGLPFEKRTSPTATSTRKSSSFEIRNAEKTTSLNGTNDERAAPLSANTEKTVLLGETAVGEKSTVSNMINEARFFNQEEEQFHLAELSQNSDRSR